MLDLWYKNAVIYCLDVETFMDSDGDGVGDFRGLSHRLDHIEALGATCIWLLPFYPTPNRDNGYDVTDFYGIDPRLGSSGDFVEFTRAARDRGFRIIIDLVANHTSIDHPWFQGARRDPKSPFRDWYVWSKEKPANIHEGVIFPGVQDAVWTYDDVAEAWYLHRFYKHQADLNIANPAVREEIERVMGYWLQLGVSGFRVDAVPFLIEYKGLPEHEQPDRDPHAYLTELRDFLSWRKAEAILLAEANIAMDEVDEYFGQNDRMQMIFNFMLNQHTYLGLVRGKAEPVRRVMKATPPLPSQAQWASFLRNHDELDLGRLTEEERGEVYAALGPDPDMQLYNRGVRRRLAPMLGGDLRQMKMAYSLMFALPGTPVIWYGDEIGMGDDLSQPERNSVRSPMQWSAGPNADFSNADPGQLVRRVISGGEFGFERVNVLAQRERPGSLLAYFQQLVRARRGCPAIGWGEWRLLETGEDSVLALCTEWRGECVVTLHNFSGQDAEVPIDWGKGDPLTPILGAAEGEKPVQPGQPIRLEPYGYRWYRLDGERR